MNAQTISPVDAQQLVKVQERLKLEGIARNGVSWFYWIAGLSIVNTVIFLAGGTLNFIFGLGATQFVDGFTSELAKSMSIATTIKVIGIVFDLGITGLFFCAGFLGLKRHIWAIVTGMILYVLDALIFILVGSWLSVAFHAWALFGLWRGLQATNALKKQDLSNAQMISAIVPE